MRWQAFFWAVLLFAFTAQANRVYVDIGSGSDVPGCGTAGAPCQTIQYTLTTIASNGDSIYVAAGTYTGPFNIPEAQSHVFVGDTGMGTIIDGLGTNRGFVYDHARCGSSDDGLVAFMNFGWYNFVFQNNFFGNQWCTAQFEANGGAILLYNDNDGGSSLYGRVQNCMFINNRVEDLSGLNNNGRSARGGAIMAHGRSSGSSQFWIVDCVFKDNSVEQRDNGGQGGAVYLQGFPWGAVIKRSDFINNSVYSSNADCGDQGQYRNAGGAIYIREDWGVNFNITGGMFMGNSATICGSCCGADPSEGGAIFLRSAGGPNVNIDSVYACTNTVDGGTIEHWDNVGGNLNTTNVTTGMFPIADLPDSSVDLCQPDTVLLNASHECATYSWQDGSKDSVFVATTPGIYWVDISLGSCAMRDSIVIDTGAYLYITTSADTGWCDTGSTMLNVIGGNNYLWTPATGLSDPAIPNPVASPTSTTTYVVTVSDTAGCIAIDSVTITVNSFGPFSISNDTTIIEGSSASINTSGGTSWVWSPTTDLSCTNCPNPIASPSTTTTYTVTATDGNGCTATGSITVTVIPDTASPEPPIIAGPCATESIFIPNLFTPDAPTNNVFMVRSSGVMQIRALLVYNRWGQVVYEMREGTSNNMYSGWDGTFKGQPLTSQVFAYWVKAECAGKEEVVLSGNVTLIR